MRITSSVTAFWPGCWAGSVAALACRHIVIEQRQLDILAHRQFIDQVEALEDEADRGLADLGEAALGQPRDLFAVKNIRAARWAVEHPHQVEQRRFAAPRRPHDRDEFTLGDRKSTRLNSSH